MLLHRKALVGFIVANRLRVQRGITFAAIFVSTMTAVGVWRASMPLIAWYWLWIGGGMGYLLLAWLIGYLDERFLWRVETERSNAMNPQLMEMLEIVRRLDRR